MRLAFSRRSRGLLSRRRVNTTTASSSTNGTDAKQALSHSGVVSLTRWMNFNDSKKELMKGYVRSNMVHGKARRKLKDVLREYVRNAAPVNPNPPSLFSSHNILCDCSEMDEAHRYAEEMFHNLVASRELEEDHCNVLADLMYTVEDIHRIKTYMNIFNIPISEKILRIVIELLRLANRPYEHVVDEFEGEMTKRTKILLAMKDLSERRHQYLKLWLLRGTRGVRARECDSLIML